MVVMGGQKIQYQIESFTTVVGQKLGHLADICSSSPGQETEVVRGGEDCGRPIRPPCTLLLDLTAKRFQAKPQPLPRPLLNSGVLHRSLKNNVSINFNINVDEKSSFLKIMSKLSKIMSKFSQIHF